ncbi:MAG: hydroxymethylbilane synthase [Gemmatimonadota bacterium]
MDLSRPLILGTRGSDLALTQARTVQALLLERHAAAGLQVELEIIRTTGDVSRASLAQIGGTGVFTKEIERALVEQRIDLAVHSLKDLPTELDEGLALVASPPRQDVRDTLIMRAGRRLADLPEGAAVGTGSTRRQGQLLALRPDLRFQEIRGNVDTRLRQARDGEVDAVILAAAGLHRLGLKDQISGYLDTDEVLPAPGQGALGLQMRADDERASLVAALNDEPTWLSVIAERAFLRTLGGGCRAPIAAWGRRISDELRLDGVVARPDGTDLRRASQVAVPERAADLGRELAEELLRAGADAILRDLDA